MTSGLRRLLLLSLVGMLAQLVDGSMGMGYGVVSTSLLTSWALAPAMASATVHLSELASTGASAWAHWRQGTVDRGAAWRLMIPGALGGIAGASLIAQMDLTSARPVTAAILFLLGLRILLRFARRPAQAASVGTQGLPPRGLPALGLFGGFIDATGGGGWGPIVTGTMLARSTTPPRLAVGTANFAEFGVTVASVGAFLVTLGVDAVPWTAVIALAVGGVAAAPLAAWTVDRLPPRVLGLLVGSAIVCLNGRTLILAWSH